MRASLTLSCTDQLSEARKLSFRLRGPMTHSLLTR